MMWMKVVKMNNMQTSNSSNERNQLLSPILKQEGLMDSLKLDIVDLYAAVRDEKNGFISLNSDKENINNTCKGDELNDIESDADDNQDEKEHELESYSI
jgi:hypothetical protein